MSKQGGDDANKNAGQVAAIAAEERNLMDPRLSDPKFQQQLAKRLVNGSAVERRAAHQFLQENNIDVAEAVKRAREFVGQQQQEANKT